MKKIAIVAETLENDQKYRSGVGVVAGESVNAAMQAGLEVTLIGPGPKDQVCHKRVCVPSIRPFRNYPSTLPFLFLWTPLLYLALRKMDLVHVHSLTPLSVWVIFLLTLMKKRPKLIFHLHTDFTLYIRAWTRWIWLANLLTKLTARSARFCCEQADLLLAPTEFFAKKMKREIGLKKQIEVWGAPIRIPDAIPETGQVLQPFIYCSCRVGEEKNIQFLFNVLAQIPEEIRLVIAGGGEIQRYKSIISSQYPKLVGRVIFLGNIPRELVFAFCEGAICYIFPSVTESYGLTVYEAMTQGLVALVPEGCCFDHIKKGIWHLPLDPSQWSWTVEILYANPSLAREKGRSGAKFVFENLSPESQLSKLAAFHTSLCG